MADVEILNSVINTIDHNTKKPEQFLSIQNEVAVDFKNSLKRLYDFTKLETQRNTNALPELITEGFDEEQIWQQIELQNESELDYLIDGVSKSLAENKKLTISITKPKSVYNSEENLSEKEKKIVEEETSDDDDDDDEEFKSNLKKQKKDVRKRKKKSSIVDDKFFKLEELDEYLTKEEKKEKQNEKNEEKSDDEFVDLFNDFSDNDNKTEEAKLLKYADFFDSPESEDENLDNSIQHKETNDEEELEENELDDNELLESLDSDSNNEIDVDNEMEEKSSSKKKVTFNLTNDSDETDSLENKNINKEVDVEIKSSLEMRQERLKNKIGKLEEEALAEKPWQLKGEVSASNRPQNSLLEEFVEFDITTRPPPVITEQTTLKLEDIIKQRIKDKAWDDVQKKFKPVETPLEYKKKLILNQEKSKESLSQIYENEYLKQKEALNPDNTEKEEEEPKLHTEIREMMHSVFSKLDALSNFHYTPKQVQPEIKIISNMPAINMEEVAPIGMSDAALLAPEEIKAKPRGDLIGKAERTKTDMKRERRRKKMRQRARQQAIEKKEKLNAIKPGIAKKYKKEKTTELAKKLSKNRNIIRMDESSFKAPKTSTAFFTQLQDEVKSHIKAKINTDTKKKQKNVLSAKKLKL
ncbi:U3 small nucleolar ribonucleoprotein MPP10 [Apis mellifera caucasica]|uniref:U3 small nucleolar ribonucleoprotein protein MPP10 n=1 Tax=Apis mellifera TaxID=7460 RepID=A0A7M7GL45_APIME|nr:U3 small nucleolar ribonucleoprotein protein MPP10 [Apis mellifera]KAG6798434.1 U3 small nucleolar ribonucleoprotein MPP10 [Apis mellifera caucasica]|eukprot:XP_006558856.1 U3 small nucleolar ribonucleoprotein protein MPP10 [Apis mellifera]